MLCLFISNRILSLSKTLANLHIPAVILVDISSSMEGGSIDELNKGFVEFNNALRNNSLTMDCAEACIISFNSSVRTEVGFRPAVRFEPPTLAASGLTAMNEAIEAALDALEARKVEYRANGVEYYRSWLFLLPHGAPTDTARENAAKSRLQNVISNRKVLYMPVGIGACADTSKLQSYYPEDMTEHPVLKASASDFKKVLDIFSVVSRSDPKAADSVQTPDLPCSISAGI